MSGFGILSSGEFQVRNATDLIGPYIGHSERQTKQILRDAKGKVLMIDEAYLLDPHRGESARGADPFRQAVIDTIVSEVQNTADEDRCIIMCGYKEPMEQMLRRANPGLARRFPIADAFVFEELDLRQLEQILDHKMEKEEFTMTDEAKQLALDMLQVAKQRTNFGNGGEVDNLLGRAMANYRTRFSQLTADQRTGDVCFEAEDIDPHYRQRSQVEGLIEQSFAGLVDMDDLKDRFNALARRATALRENGRSPTLSMPYHFAFKGPRGSGKRTIAKQMSRLYHSLRLLPIAEVVEVSARDMVAERVRGNYGGKTSKSFEMIEQAMGKVLFISEAHRLAGSGNDQTNMIVRDVREDLVEAVGKPQFSGKVVIILCGDEKPIEWMLDATPGLANRFRISLVFRGLTGDACVELLQNRLQAEAVALTLTEHEQRDLQLSFETLCHAYDWGNSRDIHLITNELVGDVFEKGFREGESPTLTGSEVLKCLKGMYRRQLSRPVHNMLQPRAQIITLGRSLGRENTEEELESVQQFPTVSLTSDNDMSGAFPYDPLLEGHTTRILRLEPAKCRADPIECHLQELNLRDAAKQRWPFNAVSYVWETQSRTKSIRCDGKTMVVRRNCELALQYLRHKQRPVYLWMDSLCINQSDKDEKSRQVLLMGEIFTAAVHVYIWLGVGSEKVTEAVFRLQKLLALRGNWGRYEILRKILIKEYKGMSFSLLLWILF